MRGWYYFSLDNRPPVMYFILEADNIFVQIIGASEASPFLVMNVAILCVCVCVCVMDRHDICFL